MAGNAQRSPCDRFTYGDYRCWDDTKLDPTHRMVTVFRRATAESFGPSAMFADVDPICSDLFPGLEVDLQRVFPPQTRVVKESPDHR